MLSASPFLHFSSSSSSFFRYCYFYIIGMSRWQLLMDDSCAALPANSRLAIRSLLLVAGISTYELGSFSLIPTYVHTACSHLMSFT